MGEYYSANVFMYQFHNGKLPNIFENYFVKLASVNKHATRQSQLYRFPLYKTKTGNRFIKKTGIGYWHSLMNVTEVNSLSIAMIKKATIESIIETY